MGRGHRFTDEQLTWIHDNLDVGIFRNQTHFTDVFNALFGTSVSRESMCMALCRRGWKLTTKQNTSKWTAEMDAWIEEHYEEYECDFVTMAKDFNELFGTDKSNCVITKRLERRGIHKPRPKASFKKEPQPKSKSDAKPRRPYRNKGMFVKGQKSVRGELPVGTIRYNSDGRPFIKVMLCNGNAGHDANTGHNYREPFWKPLQKKIWEDHYGEVPNGYIVCSLNGDPNCTDIDKIGLIDKRGTARMAKNKWWGIDNLTIKKTAIEWCNLNYAMQDAERRD